jgi:hypothetical protein
MKKSLKSKLYFRNGTMAEYEPRIAYLIWLATPGSTIRVAGDDTPVYSWEWQERKIK